jgi:hypothetical protein
MTREAEVVIKELDYVKSKYMALRMELQDVQSACKHEYNEEVIAEGESYKHGVRTCKICTFFTTFGEFKDIGPKESGLSS